MSGSSPQDWQEDRRRRPARGELLLKVIAGLLLQVLKQKCHRSNTHSEWNIVLIKD